MAHLEILLSHQRRVHLLSESYQVHFKYVYKGHDRTTMEFGTCQDEVMLEERPSISESHAIGMGLKLVT